MTLLLKQVYLRGWTFLVSADVPAKFVSFKVLIEICVYFNFNFKTCLMLHMLQVLFEKKGGRGGGGQDKT